MRAGLDQTQKRLILQHASPSLGIEKLAKMVNASYINVYNFVTDNNLPTKTESTSVKKQKAEAKIKPSEIFNVHAKDNWLL